MAARCDISLSVYRQHYLLSMIIPSISISIIYTAINLSVYST